MRRPRSPEVEVLTEQDFDAWDDWVARQQRSGSIYSTAQYLDILCRSAGGSFSVVAVRDNASFAAGLGIYRRRIFGHEMIAQRMLLAYNGPVLRDDLVAATQTGSGSFQVMDALCGYLSRQKVGGVQLHCREGNQDFRPFLERGWQVSPSYTLVVPLDDSEQLWRCFDRNARRLVRRAEGRGCTVMPDNDFECLFRAHEEVHRRKGAPLYLQEQAFRRYVKDLVETGLGTILTARLPDGGPAAAQLVLLGNHPCSHTVCAGSHRAHLSTGAAYLLRWQTFLELGVRGYLSNDLTDASFGDVTRFKQQFGGTLKMTMSLKSPYSMSYRLAKRRIQWYRAVRSFWGQSKGTE